MAHFAPGSNNRLAELRLQMPLGPWDSAKMVKDRHGSLGLPHRCQRTVVGTREARGVGGETFCELEQRAVWRH